MTERALVLRLLSSEARVDFSSFRTGYVPTPRLHAQLAGAANRLAHADIWIDDSGSITILEIKAKCRRLKSEHGLDLVILDYLQLAHGDSRRDRKDLEIAEISQGLKALAKELDDPGDRALAAEPRPRAARSGQAPARTWATCASRARSSRTPT